ncbi:hypothetical protein BGZ58_000381 [Dissophora ornata]|nr:hypothetical protein BGZ58_000381 [Dissophora ornata]
MSSKGKEPVVLIVGAGLAGLMMGGLLEQMGLQYTILERAAKVKPLGLLEGLKDISLVSEGMDIFDNRLKKLGSVGMKNQKELSGYDQYIFARPRLYELMLKLVPPHRLLMNKKILRVEEKDDKVIVHCADNMTYEGDILIGADGTNSSVRQSIYKKLDQQGVLPKSDTEEFEVGYTLMVGVAKPKDPTKYPQLEDDTCHFPSVLGGDYRIWSLSTMPGNQICWALITQFKTDEEAREQQFRNSEWGPEANEAMIKEFYNKPCPFGGIMGDLIDDTPKELISKVFVEEKMFDTWYSGRTVLIGDACHKMLPAGGQGGINAMQDAVVLSNVIYDLVDTSSENISEAFKDYYEQRHPRAKAMVNNSKFISNAMGGQTMFQRFVRHVLFNYIPDSVLQKDFADKAAYRPQVTWMPMVPSHGTIAPVPQKPSKRYTQERSGQETAV